MKTLIGLVLAGLLGFVGNADAAIITFLEDHLTIYNATYSPYGIDDEALYSGPALGQTISQSARTEVTGDPNIVGSFTNFTNYVYGEGINEVWLEFSYGTDHPSFGDLSGAGFNRINTKLSLIFKVSGNSAAVSLDGWPIGISPWSIASYELIDLSAGTYFSDFGSYGLISGHNYMLIHSLFVQTQSDVDLAYNVMFHGVTVPEPSTLILLGAGLAGLGISRKHNKTH